MGDARSGFRRLVEAATNPRQAPRSIHGGYADWLIEFWLVRDGTVALAEIWPPRDQRDLRNSAVVWSWLEKALPDTYVPYSGPTPDGPEYGGRIGKPSSVIMAVTTDGQYDRIFRDDLIAWADEMRQSYGFRTRITYK